MQEERQGKTLKETMPDLKTAAFIADRMDQIRVEKMTMPRSRERLRVYLCAPFLIPKKEIYALEAAIKKQYFRSRDVKVEIVERFELDERDPARLYQAYEESLLLELKSSRLFEYNLFRSASLGFEEGLILLDMPDTLAHQARGGELAAYLEEIFKKRLGCDVAVRMKKHRSLAENHDEDAFQTELNRVSEAFHQAKNEDLPAATEDAATKVKSKYVKKTRLAESAGYGYDFSDEPFSMDQLEEGMGPVVVRGQILSMESRSLKTGNLLYQFLLTDFTDSVSVKIFVKPEEKERLEDIIREGAFVCLKGEPKTDRFDDELVISSVSGIKRAEDPRMKRLDLAAEKRVELHAHTQLSEKDGLTHTEALVRRAAEWGHPAVAITDHGVVQSFPTAEKTAKALAKEGKEIKILYGCEGYLVDDAPGMSREEIKKAPSYHIILLAKNETGRVNLYRLVSESHLNYFSRRPRIPRSLLEECREGLILGSACEAGELYRALLRDAGEEELARIVGFYDYLEVQPLGNNAYLTRTGRNGRIYTEEELRDYVRRILELGQQYAKPVVATCDVHFLEPEDEIYRRILQAGQGFKDADQQAPLYFRTTEEMLREFDFLSPEEAQEIVVDNPRRIAELCEVISPVRPDKCPPVIAGAEEELEKLCYERAREWYGDPLPSLVAERLSKELNSVISNGYAVMYVIAKRLVQKSNECGYVVGSRGSVGSSLLASLCGISEVNPLPPHYRCPHCKHSIFDNEETRKNAGGAGADMAALNCPKCGSPMIPDGFDIPFETFLGFKGDKEPDIDLNFSSEFQNQAHEYTEVLFGKGYTFKAGTVLGIAEKTAQTYTYKYFEERGIHKRRCEINRIAKGLEGTRQSTGQHPGGIVVLPQGENIYSFTPVHYPANKEESGVVTTHFDYHSIEHNLLKLDILGHDDPTMLGRLQALTGKKLEDIPINDPKVISLFQSCEALGIQAKDIGGVKQGTLGIPEFGTGFAMGILRDAEPKSVADLVRVAGIAHGTDVWKGNVQDLILSKTATLQESICTRDDIMQYLISRGMEPALSFKIMESVRKGRVAKGEESNWPEWKKAMEEKGIPDWYIGSAEKIQYMFPKAHAAAYVTNGLRVAYCKLYHPLEYYTAYFSIRADGFDYELMGQGRETLNKNLEVFRRNKDSLTKAEMETLRDMRLAEEMYARGISFVPIDLYKAQATRFQIVEGGIMPSFVTIAGLGEQAALSLEAAAAQGPFLSKQDVLERSKLNSTLVDTLCRLGILGQMAESNQLSLEDLILQ